MNQNILLLHGALGTKHQLKNLKEVLSKDFTVHDLNFSGHGRCESEADFSLNLFTQNVIDYLNENEIKNLNIFGYSMGGYVALNVAQKHPDMVEKVMTLGTKFNWTKESAEKEVRMLNPEKIVEKVPAFAKMLAETHGENNWKKVLNKTAKFMSDLGSGAKLNDEELATIQHEIRIAVGDKDRMVTIDESEKSADLMPNGKLVILENFEHPIEKVDHVVLASKISEFMKN